MNMIPNQHYTPPCLLQTKTYLNKKNFIFILFILVSRVEAQSPVAKNNVWQRPVIIPVPLPNVDKSNIISLNGQWKTTNTPGNNFWMDTVSTASWREVTNARGFGDRVKKVFKKRVIIPAGFASKQIILRFDGVSGGAKLWVNGIYVREHWGSLMPWTADITKLAVPGKQAIITLEVDDRNEGLAAFVRGGGIQKEAGLFAVPSNYITRLQIETDLDKDYRNAEIKASIGISFNKSNIQQVAFTLKDMQGHVVSLPVKSIKVYKNQPDIVVSIPVADPLKWDAEHPNLYVLEASIINGNTIAETISKKIGFKKMEVKGNQVFINGKEIKLRGLWGGDDVKAMVAANINHTRQKWITEKLLNDCDSLGVYVLDEVPIDFAKNGVQDDPKFTYQYMDLIADLVERDRTHPSIIMWGLGNESFYGTNVKKTFDYTYAEDPSRLSMFSWSHRVPQNDALPYTAFSYHYPKFDADLSTYDSATFNSHSLVLDRVPQPNIPVIADEMAHVPLVNREEQKRDPNVRNFYGESIKLFWEHFMNTKGALGGDIFGLSDRDARRHLPEYYLIKKAYSPIRIKDSAIVNPGAGRAIGIPVKNWFDHTALNEIRVYWTVGNETGNMAGPNVQPHEQGVLMLPARQWKNGEIVNLKFIRQRDQQLIDEFNLPVNPSPYQLSTPHGPAPKIEEDLYNIKVTGNDFKVVFTKSTGLITDGIFKGTHIIKGGPFLQLGASGVSMPEWFLKSIKARTEDNEAVINISGGYAPVEISYEIRIDGRGRIAVKYTLDELPLIPPVAKRIPWDGTDVGGYTEVGLWFTLTDSVDCLKWKRKALWSAYPEDHIGRNQGTAFKKPDGKAFWPNQEDNQLLGNNTGAIGTNDFRSMKEYIYNATALIYGNHKGLTAESDAKDGVRLEVIQEQPLKNYIRFIINNEWNYTQLAQGNYMKPAIIVNKGYTNKITLRLNEISEKDQQ
jgi:hypothetical protein